MSTIRTLGPVGLNPTGEYDNTHKYERLDVVYYEGSSYVALKESIGQLPTNTDYWDCIAVGYLRQNTYDSVADMKADDTLKDGMYAQTVGYYSANDGGASEYVIVDDETLVDDGGSIHVLSNGLRAVLIEKDIKPEYFGAYGNGINNDTNAFNSMFSYILSKQQTINNETTNIPTVILKKDYLIDKIIIPTDLKVVNIKGEKARIRTGGFKFNENVGWKVNISGITFDNCNNPIEFENRNLEYGRYEIENCIFLSCTGTAIKIDRKSCQSLINKCTFRYCEKSVYIKDNDICKFTNNWLECNSAWGNSHYDVEQYSPNTAGIMLISGNIFVPGYSQTATNPCWIKIGYSANIYDNRFSGENPTIHPLIINFDQYENFDSSLSIYPIINFFNNPIVAGKTKILINNARGEINVENNSGWQQGQPVLDVADASLETTYDSLAYTDLTLTFTNNTGRTFNFRNEKGFVANAYKPSVNSHLQRFIKRTKNYQENYNFELKSSVSNYVLTVEYCSTDLKKTVPIIIGGTVNKNPGGSDYYETFLALLTIERYYDTELRYRGNCQIITANKQGITFDVLINGQSYITALPANENLKFTVSCSSPKRPIFKYVDLVNLPPIDDLLSN